MADLVFVSEPLLAEKVLAALLAAGADGTSAQASTRAMLHASRFGIDSHGVRLTAHKPTFARKMAAAERLSQRYRNALRLLAK